MERKDRAALLWWWWWRMAGAAAARSFPPFNPWLIVEMNGPWTKSNLRGYRIRASTDEGCPNWNGRAVQWGQEGDETFSRKRISWPGAATMPIDPTANAVAPGTLRFPRPWILSLLFVGWFCRSWNKASGRHAREWTRMKSGAAISLSPSPTGQAGRHANSPAAEVKVRLRKETQIGRSPPLAPARLSRWRFLAARFASGGV